MEQSVNINVILSMDEHLTIYKAALVVIIEMIKMKLHWYDGTTDVDSKQFKSDTKNLFDKYVIPNVKKQFDIYSKMNSVLHSSKIIDIMSYVEGEILVELSKRR
jgi:hypothetical protein